jgi:hypothetical protein
MLNMFIVSETISLTTGDQSLFECISYGKKIPFYEAQNWKREIAEGLVANVSGNKNVQHANSIFMFNDFIDVRDVDPTTKMTLYAAEMAGGLGKFTLINRINLSLLQDAYYEFNQKVLPAFDIRLQLEDLVAEIKLSKKSERKLPKWDKFVR